MSDDRRDGFAPLFEQGDVLLRRARSAARAGTDPGSDATASVRVTLDEQGLVAGVSVAAGWQRQLGPDKLAAAVLEAVRDASIRRLTAWGTTYGDDTGEPSTPSAEHTGQPTALDRDDFQRRLHEITTGPMPAADREAALAGLLELLQAVERGIDDVSGKLHATVTARHTGRSPDHHVTVTVTGAGEATAVHCDPLWVREAHEINIGRQLLAAFRAAYEKVAAHGVDKLIADSPLGDAHRATQDPFGLARRLRLTD